MTRTTDNRLKESQTKSSKNKENKSNNPRKKYQTHELLTQAGTTPKSIKSHQSQLKNQFNKGTPININKHQCILHRDRWKGRSRMLSPWWTGGRRICCRIRVNLRKTRLIFSVINILIKRLNISLQRLLNKHLST